VIFGLILGAVALAGLTRPAELAGVPACTGGGSQDCLTREPATVNGETSIRSQWLTGERGWFLDVNAVPPEVRDDDVPKVTVPEQPGQDEIREGEELTVVYYRGHPVLLELPGGTVLETDKHPRRYAPTMGYLAIAVLGMGAFFVRVGWRYGRRSGWWRRVAYREPTGGALFAVPLFAGCAGAFTQSIAGTSRWPALIVVLIVSGALGSLLLLAKHRLSATEPDRPPRHP